MRWMNLFCALVFFSPNIFGQSDSDSKDSLLIRSLYDDVLLNGQAYENLRTLTKDIGHRLSGSESAGKAMQWGAEVMRSYGADNVSIMPVMVPHWTRGSVANATARWGDGQEKALHITALGGSVGTDPSSALQAGVTVVKQLAELKDLPSDQTQGRIVLFNRPMDPVQINTGSAYGGAYDQRGNGASAAAAVGARGALVRSLTHALDTLPHTGAMRYQEGIDRIPAAAISTVDAAWLAKAIEQFPDLTVQLELDCQAFDDVEQGNVIGTWYGTELPNEIITLGGHLDSWDIGEGAHDDGAGVVHTLEVLRVLKAIGYQPRRTLRFVLFINEENGNRGGITYAEKAKEEMEESDWVHVAALESDAGGFVPRGFRIDASDEVTNLMRSWTDLFDPYNIHQFKRGGAGVDISPLKELTPRPTLVGLSPDGQRYFDFHHSAQDVFENVHKRELELGAATFAAAVMMLDQHLPSPTNSRR
jgi:carboxypeptidase Q